LELSGLTVAFELHWSFVYSTSCTGMLCACTARVDAALDLLEAMRGAQAPLPTALARSILKAVPDAAQPGAYHCACASRGFTACCLITSPN